MAFNGFPPKVRSTPVPSPIFGPLLEEIDDLSELKCILRIVWLVNQKKGHPRFLTLNEILSDRVLVKALASIQNTSHTLIKKALSRCVSRGSLITGRRNACDQSPGEILYMINTEINRKSLLQITNNSEIVNHYPKPVPWEGSVERSNIFALYEDNIGMLSPIIADELKKAEQLYPATWIEKAFKEAVSRNRRNWRYIQRILQRWELDGTSDGRFERSFKKAGYY